MLAVLLSLLALCVSVVALVRALCDHIEYKRRFREYQRRILSARRSLRQFGNLANEIAHEIKNPITAILCSAETLDLLIGDDIDPAHRKSLRYIKEYGDNLLRLVSDFLDVNRAEIGKLERNPEPTKIKPVVESIIGLLDSNAIKKQITIKHFITDPEMQAWVDPKHFKQVLFNLLHNAIKFTPEKGEVHVVAKCDFPNPYVKIAVKDNGVGIPEEDLNCLFNPYAKFDGQGSSLDTGVGLGLALCKTLVELEGGMIFVKSQEGLGTSFEFTVPVHEGSEEEEPKLGFEISGEKAGQPLLGQRFLVVDEDIGARESLSGLIQALGGVVDSVAMAVDAVEAIENCEYDAVMLDHTKDGVYSYELARIIRDDYRSEKTRIIVTAREQIDEQILRESGADACLEKPLNGKVVLESLVRPGKFRLQH